MIHIGNYKELVIESQKETKPVTKRNFDELRFIEETRVKTNNYMEQQLDQPSAIKDAFDNLDKDVVTDHNLTSIDFNTHLSDFEVGSIVALQMMSVLQVGGTECSLLARSIKRHKVSLNRLGRTEKVQIMQGEREQEANTRDTSLFGKIRGIMGNDKNKTE